LIASKANRLLLPTISTTQYYRKLAGVAGKND
jgi:hypothetical protein